MAHQCIDLAHSYKSGVQRTSRLTVQLQVDFRTEDLSSVHPQQRSKISDVIFFPSPYKRFGGWILSLNHVYFYHKQILKHRASVSVVSQAAPKMHRRVDCCHGYKRENCN